MQIKCKSDASAFKKEDMALDYSKWLLWKSRAAQFTLYWDTLDKPFNKMYLLDRNLHYIDIFSYRHAVNTLEI